jgi:hypothetical protein
MQKQIDELSDYIMNERPNDITEGGACEVAVDIMKADIAKLTTLIVALAESERKLRVVERALELACDPKRFKDMCPQTDDLDYNCESHNSCTECFASLHTQQAEQEERLKELAEHAGCSVEELQRANDAIGGENIGGASVKGGSDEN